MILVLLVVTGAVTVLIAIAGLIFFACRKLCIRNRLRRQDTYKSKTRPKTLTIAPSQLALGGIDRVNGQNGDIHVRRRLDTDWTMMDTPPSISPGHSAVIFPNSSGNLPRPNPAVELPYDGELYSNVADHPDACRIDARERKENELQGYSLGSIRNDMDLYENAPLAGSPDTEELYTPYPNYPEVNDTLQRIRSR